MKIDYFTTVPPWPQDSGGRLRVGAIYDSLLRHHLEVRLIVVGEKPDRDTRREIARVGGRVYPGRREAVPAKLRRYLLGAVCRRDPIAAQVFNARRIERLARLVAAARPDAVLLGNVYLCPLIPMLERFAPGVRIIVDNHNVESLLHRRLSAQCRSLRVRVPAAIIAYTTQRLEREYLPRADQIWACSDQDASYLLGAYPLPKVQVVPNGVDTAAFTATLAAEPTAIVFTGSFWYPPNELAAQSLIDVSERLTLQGLRHTLYLVGKSPTRAMLRKAGANPSIVITGAVPDVRPYLAKAAVFAAPLSAGSGTKLKLLQAMATAKAIVTTSIGAEGLRLTNGIHGVVTDDRDDFARQLVRLLHSPEERARLGAAARRHVVRHFSLEAIDRTVSASLSELWPLTSPPA